MSIQESASKIKTFFGSDNGRDLATILIVILVGIVGFSLGRLSITEKPGEVTIKLPDNSTMTANAYTGVYSKNTGTSTTQTASAINAINGANGGAYVASKNGTKYYLTSCSGANRIKDENKIWFNSTSEAESAGYSKSTTCKGY